MPRRRLVVQEGGGSNGKKSVKGVTVDVEGKSGFFGGL